MKTSRSFYKQAIIVTLILCAAIVIGVPLYRYALPEPEHCVLCEYRELHHAPVLMNLATGEVVELSVELRMGVFRLVAGAGVNGCSIGGQSCEVTLPQAGVSMNDRLFCRKHRVMLAVAEGRGYALLDLHEAGRAIPYVVANGVEYEISGYSISVSKTTEGLLSAWEIKASEAIAHPNVLHGATHFRLLDSGNASHRETHFDILCLFHVENLTAICYDRATKPRRTPI